MTEGGYKYPEPGFVIVTDDMTPPLIVAVAIAWVKNGSVINGGYEKLVLPLVNVIELTPMPSVVAFATAASPSTTTEGGYIYPEPGLVTVPANVLPEAIAVAWVKNGIVIVGAVVYSVLPYGNVIPITEPDADIVGIPIAVFGAPATITYGR